MSETKFYADITLRAQSERSSEGCTTNGPVEMGERAYELLKVFINGGDVRFFDGVYQHNKPRIDTLESWGNKVSKAYDDFRNELQKALGFDIDQTEEFLINEVKSLYQYRNSPRCEPSEVRDYRKLVAIIRNFLGIGPEIRELTVPELAESLERHFKREGAK